MKWYEDKKVKQKVVIYKDLKAFESEGKQAEKHGWEVQSASGGRGDVKVMGTLTKTVLTGGLGLLVGGRSRKPDKVTVTWKRAA